MKNKITIFLCVFIIATLFCGCGSTDYSGDYKDLYTVAINSLLWNNGHSYGADKEIDSEIEILEKDQYGRILFTYKEKYYAGAKLSFSAILISQCTSDNFVYYYEDINFLIKQQKLYSSEINNFTVEEIDYLKTLNDWDLTIDLEKCVKKELTNTKNDITHNRQQIEQEAIKEFKCEDSKYNLFLDYLTNDISENFIVYGSLIKINEETIFFVAFVKANSDDIKFLVPSNLYSYQHELADFKNENGWKY